LRKGRQRQYLNATLANAMAQGLIGSSDFCNSIGQKQTSGWSAPLMVDSFKRRF